jgi:PAS domain S-box-containing protein
VWFLEAMDRVNRAIQGTNDVEHMTREVMRAALDIFTCDRSWLVYPCDPRARSWHAVHACARPEYPGALAPGTQFPMDDDVAAVFSAGLAAPGSVLLGPAGSPLIPPPRVGEPFAIRSQIAMTIDAKSASPYLWGLHQCSRAREWTMPEQRLFQEIGRRFGDALASLSTLRSLRDSEARFRTFVDHARDAFFLMDEELTVVDVNVQACESLGHGRDELIGMHPRDFDARLDERSIARLAERASAGETITFETLHRRKDGTRFPVEIRSHAFRQQGKEFYLALVRDITERKRAEQELRASEDRYRTLVDFAADAFMTHAEDGKVIDVNPQACENLGYTRDELIGMVPADFDADLDREALRRVGERVGAGETITIETRHRRKDGSLFPVEVRLRHVAQGDRWIVISLSRDITARKRVEEERDALRRLEADLMRMSRVITMGELTASIAHEVNQPLAAMVVNAAACERWLAAQPPQAAEARRALRNITADGQRASAVIGRIRALMKRQSPRKEPLDMNEAIREVLALVRQQLRHSDVVLRLADALPRIDGDKVQLQQVLLNLIVNAIDAMSQVDGRRRELTIVSRQDGANAVIEVGDSGIGLDAERAERLFEAFYTTKEEGMGIGLAISRSIVEAHEGRMWAVPNVPHGAVFLVSLPVTVQ